MREKYESLALVQLKELAKVRGIRGVSAMKKAEVVEAMLAQDERDKSGEDASGAAEKAAFTPAPRSAERAAYASAARTAETPAARSADRTAETPAARSADRTAETQAARPAGRTAETPASRPAGRMAENVASRSAERTAETVASRSAERISETPVDRPAERAETARAESHRPEGGRTEGTRPEGSRPAQAEGEQPVRPARVNEAYDSTQYPVELDSGIEAQGILEVMPDGYGFIRSDNYLPGSEDVYVAPSQIRRFGLKTGDILRGNKRIKTQQEKFSALLFVRTINGYTPEESARRTAFEDMTPIFPDKRIKLETPGCSVAMRVMDLISPVGKGQRGMIVSPPKAGKTTLLKEVAKSILRTNPHMHMLILLIDERPEEVTDIKEAICGDNVEVIYSTFDELPDHHKRVAEMVVERAKRLVEHKKEVVILLDSITRLTRAYNLVVPPSGRTLSGGLDPAALHMPKRFFGAARNMREGGSLTILATALVDTGSKMDDVIYEEFKGTGNMEIVLDRKLSEKRIFPAIDIAKSSTRREDLLLDSEELEAISIMRKALNGLKSDEATDRILDMFARTRNNREFVANVKKNRFI